MKSGANGPRHKNWLQIPTDRRAGNNFDDGRNFYAVTKWMKEQNSIRNCGSCGGPNPDYPNTPKANRICINKKCNRPEPDRHAKKCPKKGCGKKTLRARCPNCNVIASEAFRGDFDNAIMRMADDFRSNGKVKINDLLLAPSKKEPRTLYKVAFKYKFDTRSILDFIRCSVVFDTVEDVYKGLYHMYEGQARYGFEIIRIKDRFRSGHDNVYRDILCNIRLTRSGLIGEVQLHQKELVALKNKGHEAYDLVREVTGLESVISKYLSGNTRRRRLANDEDGAYNDDGVWESRADLERQEQCQRYTDNEYPLSQPAPE